MRNPKGQKFVIESVPIARIKVAQTPLSPSDPSDQKELNRLSAAASRIKARGPALVTRNPSGEVWFSAGRLQLAAAQAVGAESLLCAVFDAVPDPLAELGEVFHTKKTCPIQIAELIAPLHETEGFEQTELATLLDTQKSTICEFYSLNKLPDDVKADCRSDRAVPRSQLVEIAKLAADKQAEAYWQAKQSIVERRNNHGAQIDHDLKEFCALLLRAANKGTRILVKFSSSPGPLAACAKNELFTAMRALIDALFGLKGFIEPNWFKKILRSFLRSMI